MMMIVKKNLLKGNMKKNNTRDHFHDLSEGKNTSNQNREITLNMR